MHPAGRLRRFALLLALLSVTASLSGCLDKAFGGRSDDGDERRARTIGFRLPGLDEQYPQEDGPVPSCDGCIPLRRGAEPTPMPGEVAAAPPPPPRQVSVPFPNDGDTLLVRRSDPPHLGPSGALPSPQGLAIDWPLIVEGVTEHQMPGHYKERYVHGTGAVFRTAEARDTTIEILIALATREVMAVEMSGPVRPAYPGLEPIERPAHGREHVHPETLTLFEFGAHLWGRTLRVGETFTFDRTPAGMRTELVFIYTVDLVRDATAEVRLDLVAADGARRTWSLTMLDGVPYPAAVVEKAGRGEPSVPVQVGGTSDLAIALRSRGDQTLRWGPVDGRAGGRNGPFADGDMFRLGDSHALPLLDHVPLYPLATAVRDLRLLDPATDGFLRTTDALLVHATLQADWRLGHGAADLPPGAVGELRWSLLWADKAGDVWARTVERFVLDDGRLAPFAHRAAPGDMDGASPHAREIPRHTGVTWFASGHDAVALLSELGADGPIDHVAWRLDLGPYGRVRGTLSIGALAAPAMARTGEAYDEAVVTLALAQGTVQAFVVRTS